MIKVLHRSFFLFIILLVAVACRQEAGVSAENVNLDVTVTDSLVGETTLIVTVTDDDGNIIENPGTLSVRGDMDHAGMTPVIRDASESNNGVFSVPFEWTMGGAWTVEVTLTLDNEEVVTETYDYEILTEASEDTDMGDMDMSEDDDSDMDHSSMSSGETSAVYMSITNNGDSDMTIAGVQTEVAEIAELHETVIENDIARMDAVEALVIPAGETVELRPAGKHIMLMKLTEDIIVADVIEIELLLESGESVAVSVVVQDMLMDELEAGFEFGDLTISNVWARPASSGMADMDMSEDDEMHMPMEATEEAGMGMSEDNGESTLSDMSSPSLWKSLVATTDLMDSDS